MEVTVVKLESSRQPTFDCLSITTIIYINSRLTRSFLQFPSRTFFGPVATSIIHIETHFVAHLVTHIAQIYVQMDNEMGCKMGGTIWGTKNNGAIWGSDMEQYGDQYGIPYG